MGIREDLNQKYRAYSKAGYVRAVESEYRDLLCKDREKDQLEIIQSLLCRMEENLHQKLDRRDTFEVICDLFVFNLLVVRKKEIEDTNGVKEGTRNGHS